MDKSKLELFKQALNEGVSNKFDKLAASCTEEIVCSERHNLAMRTIIYGKTDTKRVWSPKMKRIVAILIAAALLLTSCGIIFRNEIREIFDEFFVSIKYDNSSNQGKIIKDVYSLCYVPDGYYLEEKMVGNSLNKYRYINDKNEILVFEQNTINGLEYVIDSETGYSKVLKISKYEIYHRITENYNYYIWNDGIYSMKIKTSTELTSEELVLIIEGIIRK